MVTSFNSWEVFCRQGPGFTSIQKSSSDTGLKYFSMVYKRYTFVCEYLVEVCEKTSKLIWFENILSNNWKKFEMLFARFSIPNEVFFKFPNTKIREDTPCYINSIYQVLTIYSEKSLSNQKVHPPLLKSNVTNNILKLPRKKFQ